MTTSLDHHVQGDALVAQVLHEKELRRWTYGALALLLSSLSLALLTVYFYLVAGNVTAACWGLASLLLSTLLAVELLYRRHSRIKQRNPSQHHIKALFIGGVAASLGGLQGIGLNAVLCVHNGPKAWSISGHSVALFMALALFVLGVATLVSTRMYVRFDRQPQWVFLMFLCYYVLVALGAAASCVLLFVMGRYVEPFIYCAITASLALTVAAESRYRYICFINNRTCHNHLRVLSLLGLAIIVAGLVLVPFYAYWGILWVEAGTISEPFHQSPFISVIAALWMERWGVTLCWTAWYFRSTEDAVSLLVPKTHNFLTSNPPLLVNCDEDDEDDV